MLYMNLFLLCALQMKKVVQAYHVEAKWRHESFVPTMEEYMRIALVTSAYSMLATTSLVGMGNIANREVFEWISNGPKIVTASTINLQTHGRHCLP